MRRRREPKGFTLLELLAALTLLGMVLALVFQGIRLGGKSWENGEARLEEWRRREVALELLSRQLSAVIFPAGGLYVQTPVFFGNEKQVVFLTKYPFENDAEGRLVRVGYAVEERENGSLAIRYQEMEPDLPGAITRNLPPIADWRILSRGVSEMRFEYLRTRPGGEGTLEWVSQWAPSTRRKGPVAIRVWCQWGADSLSMVVPLRPAFET
jgi:general secretion pathway protein J